MSKIPELRSICRDCSSMERRKCGCSSVTVRYPASRGYVRYDYPYDKANHRITVAFTGSATRTEIAMLLPRGSSVKNALLDGKVPPQLDAHRLKNRTYGSILVTNEEPTRWNCSSTSGASKHLAAYLPSCVSKNFDMIS